jgi:type IV pilus assembly protein PilM
MMEPSAVQVLPIVDPHDTASEWAAQEPLPEHGRNPYADSPYTSPTLAADLNAELHHAILTAPTSIGTLTEDASGHDVPVITHRFPPPPPGNEHHFGLGAPDGDPLEEEIAQAVSVAAAYFEDTLAEAPSKLLSAGPLSADRLGRILERTGVAETDGLRVREIVESEDLLSDAVKASVPRSWLAGVLGALRG